MKCLAAIMIVLTVTVGFLCGEENKGSKEEKLKTARIINCEIFTHLDLRAPPSPSLSEMIKSKSLRYEVVEDVLMAYVRGKTFFDDEGGNETRKKLTRGGIRLLGEIKSKNGLPLIREIFNNDPDERLKSSCVFAILEIEDDPVSFMKELQASVHGGFADKKDRYILFEKFLDRFERDISEGLIGEEEKLKRLSFLKDCFLRKTEDIGILVKIDKLIRQYDPGFKSDSTRNKILDDIAQDASDFLDRYRRSSGSNTAKEHGLPSGYLSILARMQTEKSLKIMEGFFDEVYDDDIRRECAKTMIIELKNPIPFLKTKISKQADKLTDSVESNVIYAVDERIRREGLSKNESLVKELKAWKFEFSIIKNKWEIGGYSLLSLFIVSVVFLAVLKFRRKRHLSQDPSRLSTPKAC